MSLARVPTALLCVQSSSLRTLSQVSVAFLFFFSKLTQPCVIAVLGAPNAVAVHLFKNWWGGFENNSVEVEQHATEDPGTAPYGTGPYGTGPYGFSLSSGNISFVSHTWSEDTAAWLLSPACKLNSNFPHLARSEICIRD